jgi:hypothetical protein
MAALTVWKFDTVEGGGENERRTLTMNDVEKSKMLDVCREKNSVNKEK